MSVFGKCKRKNWLYWLKMQFLLIGVVSVVRLPHTSILRLQALLPLYATKYASADRAKKQSKKSMFS